MMKSVLLPAVLMGTSGDVHMAGVLIGVSCDGHVAGAVGQVEGSCVTITPV